MEGNIELIHVQKKILFLYNMDLLLFGVRNTTIVYLHRKTQAKIVELFNTVRLINLEDKNLGTY